MFAAAADADSRSWIHVEARSDARLLARRLELCAGARDVAGERTQEIRVVTRHPLDPAAERRLQHRRDHSLLAMLGKQGDPLTGIDGDVV